MEEFNDLNVDYNNDPNNFKNPTKTLEVPGVKIALILCVIAVAMLFLPCITFPDKALFYYRNIEHNMYNLFAMHEIEEPFMYIALALLAGFVLTAVFFLTDHPKLTLLPLIVLVLLPMIVILSVLSDYAWETGGQMTACPPIQMGCTVILIIVASVTPKVKKKPERWEDDKNLTKALDLTRVKIALILCVIASAVLFLPYITFSDAVLANHPDIKQNMYNLFALQEIQESYKYIAPALLSGFILTAVFFLTDHPKLTLLPLFLVIFPMMDMAYILLLIVNKDNSGEITACLPIQTGCMVILIILSFATKKVKKRLSSRPKATNSNGFSSEC